jgi:ribulose-bisphosphate carboxylase large chain
MNEHLSLSGERFTVTYSIAGDEREARARAHGVCLEQTVELSDNLVPDGDIRDHLVGRIESFRAAGEHRYEAAISYAVETSGFELPQLMNVLFGNTSHQPGIRVEALALPDVLLGRFKGPRFGRPGLRDLLGEPKRPLLATAVKPVGLSAADLGDLVYRLAVGGIDLIKDDHNLANQPFAPFRERVIRCAEAVRRANRETGGRSIYVPHVSGPADQIADRARFAQQAGAGGLLVMPGLVGWDVVRCLADDDRIGLPIMSHPAFLGSFVIGADAGVSPAVLLGQLPRLAGADVTAFANFGGRFAASRSDCEGIAAVAAAPMASIRPMFPAPAGGMSLTNVPSMIEAYGRDVVMLMTGGLYNAGPNLVENCRRFRELARTSVRGG